MRTHLKIIGLVNLALGALGVLGGVLFMVGMPLFGLIDFDAFLPMTIVGLFGGAFTILFALPSVLCGIGLLALKPWARIGTMILSVLSLFGFPIGTLWGGYSLWALSQDESKRLISERSSF